MFIGLAGFTVMNMLIGILCEAVSAVTEESQNEMFAREVAAQISVLVEQVDEDHDGHISKQEVNRIVMTPSLTHGFTDIGVDVVGLADFADFIFEQTEQINYMQFANMVALFRGNKTATVKDVTEIIEGTSVRSLLALSHVG